MRRREAKLILSNRDSTGCSRLTIPQEGRRIKWLKQRRRGECGPLVLAMILRYHGLRVSRSTLNVLCQTSMRGISALRLIQAARALNCGAIGVRLSSVASGAIAPPAILHWRPNHYVILEATCRGHVHLVDPLVGRRLVRTSEAKRRFTGIAILVSPPQSSRMPHSGIDSQRWANSPQQRTVLR